MWKTSGHVFTELRGDALTKHNEDFPGHTNGLVKLTPGGWLLPIDYENIADDITETKYKKTDVVVMSYPMSGATCVQEMIWTMRNNPDLNNPKASLDLNFRVPHLEGDVVMSSKRYPALSDDCETKQMFRSRCPVSEDDESMYLQIAHECPDPRTIKTHFPFSLLCPDLLTDAKVVYVLRNPKDVCCSFYHHSRLTKGMDFTHTLDQFVQYFISDNLMYGSYWQHIKEAWMKKDHPAFHVIYYEELLSDPLWEVKRLNFFLGTNLTDDQMPGIAQHCNFEAMKQRGVVPLGYAPDQIVQPVMKRDGGFYREGKVGTWRTRLNKSQATQIDMWTKANTKCLDDLKLYYDPIIPKRFTFEFTDTDPVLKGSKKSNRW
ncbi:unnamed protein product [Meganyctiphanes norvegica]|uniref:Sulfotransferase domain-containing protein n=1 Tax=Meganyctiphanes norvegica TaxID=48144 RepID=A0AAV2RTW4_MEGNR